MQPLKIILIVHLLCSINIAGDHSPANLMETHVRYLAADELQGRYPGTEGDSLAQIYIKDYFISIGLKSYIADSNYFQPFSVDYDYDLKKETFSANVIGFIPGKNSKSNIIIGAHHDHIGIRYKHSRQDTIYNGADDNASGVAMILELASRCMEYNTFESNLIIIAFGAEEKHSIGSYYFLDNRPDSLGGIKAMLNFDMVGRMEDDELFINHTWSADEWVNYLDAIDTRLDLDYDISGAWTDSRVFLKEDIPSLWFYTGNHSDYHRPSDEFQELNYEGMEKISDYAFELIKFVSQDSVKLTFDD